MGPILTGERGFRNPRYGQARLTRPIILKERTLLDARLWGGERRHHVEAGRQLLNQLPLAHRSVMLLHFVEEFSLEEIASITSARMFEFGSSTR